LVKRGFQFILRLGYLVFKGKRMNSYSFKTIDRHVRCGTVMGCCEPCLSAT